MKLKTFLLVWLAGGLASAADVSSPDILAGLRPEHPRLIVTAAAWNDLQARRTNDTEVAAIINLTVAQARNVLKAPPLVYKKEGRRLLAVSREALERVELCSFAYRLTGEKVFADRAQQDMLAAAAFANWNPSHFLDTAEMTAALALGYDWLFDVLPATTRATLRQAILEKGLQPGLAVRNGWKVGHNNWNQVCFGGLTLGALAIAEDQPDAARELLTSARTNNLNGLMPYVPDGIYPEGPGYWSYGTTYEVLMLSALQTALGTDWDLSVSPGLLTSAAALVEQTGPTGRPFNFSDGGDGVALNSTLFWFAQKLRQPELVYFQNQLLQGKLAGQRVRGGLSPLLPLWLAGLPKDIPPPALPLAWQGEGPNPVGVFRSSWTDSNALFLAFKGGAASNNHGHMDAGSFVLDADGVRWACDLGAQEYLSVESKGWNLWDGAQGGDRWRIYRLNNFSHNTLTLGGKLHQVAGHARITSFATHSATVDLTPVFAGQARSVVRRFTVGENKTVQVRDEIAGAKPDLTVRWQMMTHAEIQTQGGQATLRQDGKVLVAKILSPASAHFEAVSAQPPDDGVNEPNRGAHILAVNASVPTSGELVVEIELQPPPATSSH